MSDFLNKEGLERLKSFEESEPLFMLNLLKYKTIVAETGKTGRETYSTYMKAATSFFELINAEIVFKGAPQATILGPKDEEPWDEVLIVKYANKNEFFKLMSMEGYPRDIRSSALSDSRLIFCK